MSRIRHLALAAALAASTLSAHAGLVSRGNGLIYDDVRNITWLADFNYVNTSGYTGTGVDTTTGTLNWDAAVLWADTLVYGGFSDWRLPTLNPSDTTCSGNDDAGGGFGLQYFGTGCTGGELSHLFVTDLGNQALTSVLDQVGDTAEQIANLALFSNVLSRDYWSSTEYAPVPSDAWLFNAVGGIQSHVSKTSELFAVAVRPGDVAAAVPEPQSLALVLLALGAAVVARRRRPV